MIMMNFQNQNILEVDLNQIKTLKSNPILIYNNLITVYQDGTFKLITDEKNK